MATSKRKKFLVTGGAGFIGSNIVKKLLSQGELVRVVDNFSTGKRDNIKEFVSNPRFELIEGSLSDLGVCRRAVKGMDFVLHQAAIPSVPRSIADPLSSNNSNVSGTLNMLVAARDQGVKKFVYASSSSIYGDNPKLPKREDFPINPISPYSLTKYVGERYAQLFWKIYNLPTISLRYFNVFGPKQNPQSQYAALIPKFINAVIENKKPVIYGDGRQTRDFTYVDNVVEANLLAAKSRKGFGEVFNVACHKQTSLLELIDILKDIFSQDINPRFEKARIGDVKHSLADVSKAKKFLNYSPQVELREGLRGTIEWFKGHEISEY